jgi:hypothetical protein
MYWPKSDYFFLQNTVDNKYDRMCDSDTISFTKEKLGTTYERKN